MKVLAIETSTLTGSVALVEEDRVIGEITLSVSVQHSERLMPAVERLLQDAGVDLPSIDLFAVAVGPGSFTGVRIGIAAAQGLSLSTGKPVVGISTLEGLAFNGLYFPGLVVPLLNAFRGEVYRGIYRFEKGLPRALREDAASGIEALTKELELLSEPILLLGDGVPLCEGPLCRRLGEGRVLTAPPALSTPRASSVAWLALSRFQEGLASQLPLPRYLRKAG